MLDYLHNLDVNLFLFINGLHNNFFDFVMVYASAKLFWIPLYLVLLYLLIKEYRQKTWLILGFVVLLILFSDQLSVHAFKNVFMRLRPCHNEDLQLIIHTVTPCGGQYGFVSSHAANSFALAFFMGTLLSQIRWIPWLMYSWAFLIIYSRIYLGQHYPGDVLGGAVLGMIVGMIVIILYHLVEKLVWKRFAKE